MLTNPKKGDKVHLSTEGVHNLFGHIGADHMKTKEYIITNATKVMCDTSNLWDIEVDDEISQLLLSNYDFDPNE